MSWADEYIESLKKGETVKCRPRGNSMTGIIESGQLCTIEPIKDFRFVTVGSVVLCKVNRNVYLHLIHSVFAPCTIPLDLQYQIGNNRGRMNGWIDEKHIYGVLTKVED